MTKRIKTKFDEDELRARRVFTKIEQNYKSAYNFTRKKFVKNTKKFDTPSSNEVVVRLTGSSNSYQKWKSHFEYNIKKMDYSLFEDENIVYKGKDETKIFESYFNDSGYRIPNESEIIEKGKREVLQFAFSMKHHETTPADLLMKAVIKTVKEKYPNNASYFVFHGDTDNPHIHCDLKVCDNFGKRIDVRKNDLFELRVNFAKNLNDLGIVATATKKYTRTKDKTQDELKQSKEEMKKHHYEVVDFGKAKYKFDDNAKDSYFVSYKTTKGEITTIWSKELEKVVKDSDLKVGEFAKFKIVGKAPVETVIRKFDKISKKREVYKKTTTKNVWDISILGRAEKDLKESSKTNKKVSYNYEEQQLSDLDIKTAEFIKMKKEREAKQNQNLDKKSNRFANLKKKSDLER